MDVEPRRVLDVIADRRYAQALLEHERNARVVNTSGAYYWIDDAGKYRILSGLLPRLRSVFWRHSKIRGIKKQAYRLGTPGSHSRAKRGGRFAGLIKGSQVHRELREFVTLDAERFARQHGALHPYSRRVLRVLVDEMRWHPFLPEKDIADELLGIGTSVDMILVDAQGRLVLIEVKTGYRDYFEQADGQMRGAVVALKNNVLNQATMQVAVAALILQRRYALPAEAMRLYVLRVDDAQVELVPVPPRFLQEFGDAIYRNLAAFATRRAAR